MLKNDIPLHIKRDIAKLAYDRTQETIHRILNVHGASYQILALISHHALEAAFSSLYFAARHQYGPDITPQAVYKIWGESMSKNFDLMAKGYDTMLEYNQEISK